MLGPWLADGEVVGAALAGNGLRCAAAATPRYPATSAIAAATPTVLRLSTRDPEPFRRGGTPPGPGGTAAGGTAAGGAAAGGAAGLAVVVWVPPDPDAIRPRARANSRTTHTLAAVSSECAWARLAATDRMAP